MRVKEDKVQRDAHALLQEWSCGPAADLGEEHKSERVQGEGSAMSAPERYANAYARWDRLDRSVRHVRLMSRDLGRVLDQHYWDGVDERECAEATGLSLRTWRDRLITARASFLAAYNMSCEEQGEPATRSALMG